jgi:hypothetical protein
MEALDQTRYRLAELSGTIEAFREFQKKYPTSRYGSKARQREEELAFLKARDVGTEAAFRDFLNMYKTTTLVSGISEVRAFIRARQTGKVYAYQDFLAAYPMLTRISWPPIQGAGWLGNSSRLLMSSSCGPKRWSLEAILWKLSGISVSWVMRLRTYVDREKTRAGRQALLMLEEKVVR